VMAKIPKDALLIIIGDKNARIGNMSFPGVKRFNESEMNENGYVLTNVFSITHYE
jgi:hypothetical protein